MEPRLIVGLGNPGAEYQHTRHNAGFWFLDALAAKYGCSFDRNGKFDALICQSTVAGKVVFLVKPLTFMNRSGQAVAAVARFYKIAPEEILVAHDELDFLPGVVRLKKAGGHGGHNGLRDLLVQLPGAGFYRLRFGIGRPAAANQLIGYVLGKPRVEERMLIDAAVQRVINLSELLLAGKYDLAATALNRG